MKGKILSQKYKNSKVALITGGANGIGRSICLSLANEGYNIAINFKSSEAAANETNKMVSELGSKAITIKCDVTQRKAVAEMIKEILENFGGLDVLVNNAGVLEQKNFSEISDLNWNHTVNNNLTSAFICTQEVSKILRPEGSIVNISSIGGQLGGSKAPHYAASKGGLITFTKSMARILAPSKIRVNAVAPGYIKTKMFNHILAVQNRTDQSLLKEIPLERIGEPSDIGHAVAFLVSDRANYITGETLNVNGGIFM